MGEGSLDNSTPARSLTTSPEASHYRARYYDPSLGRFISEDPLGFKAGEDFYSYAFNSPTGLTDPRGLSAADVQRLRQACKQCTDNLVDEGTRVPSGPGSIGGGGILDLLRRVPFGWVNDIEFWFGPKNSCRGQAENAMPCIAKNTKLDDKWTFSVEPIWGGSHYIVQGQSNNPSDPVVICDPWLYRFFTESRLPHTGGKK